MTQEEKNLLIRDLSSRLPYNCIVSVAEGGINGIQWDDATLNSYLFHQIMEEDGWEYIKPYLRPLSSMTEEEIKEYTSYCFEQPFLQKDKTPNLGSVPMCIDWLNTHHFDFRGLIQKGLALEAKEGI